jgi:hypothetical protein
VFRPIERLGAGLRDQVDLVGLLWTLVAIQSLMPPGSFLARPDLSPWLTLSLSLAAMLRARAIGDGPHPMLSVQRGGIGRTMRRIAQALIPWVLLIWAETGRTRSLTTIGVALGLSAFVAWLLGAAREEGRTAWNPPGISEPLVGTLAAALAVLAAIGIGRWQRILLDTPLASWIGPPALLGLGFLCVSAAGGHLRNLRQRVRAGRRDGKGFVPSLFRPALALLGPSVGLWALLALVAGPVVAETSYGAAFVASLHVVAWAAIIWPRPTPVAIACLLHEVVPAGGQDRHDGEAARSFHQPPAGALRLHPLQIRKTRSVHPWYVPVKGNRIGDFDDPIRPLWTPPPTPQPAHVLGDAAFELDPVTGRPQTRRITLKIRGRDDVMELSAGDVQSRRIYVVRAFPPVGGSRRRVPSTYRWDQPVPESTLQVVDAATESVELTDGSILVLSSEGVARAFQLEIGQPVLPGEDRPGFRPPQLEDFSEP